MKIPEGWPTEEMVEAALVNTKFSARKKSQLRVEIADYFTLMLAAAPTPPALPWTGNCPGEQRDCEAPNLCGKEGFCFRNDGEISASSAPEQHYEEQPDGTITPADPLDKGIGVLTPPAPEVEPVGVVKWWNVGGSGKFYKVQWTLPVPQDGSKLYTHPADDGLRKSAEKVCAWFGEQPKQFSHGEVARMFQALRAELETKS